jgi:hypothetical protein
MWPALAIASSRTRGDLRQRHRGALADAGEHQLAQPRVGEQGREVGGVGHLDQGQALVHRHRARLERRDGGAGGRRRRGRRRTRGPEVRQRRIGTSWTLRHARPRLS